VKVTRASESVESPGGLCGACAGRAHKRSSAASQRRTAHDASDTLTACAWRACAPDSIEPAVNLMLAHRSDRGASILHPDTLATGA